MTTALTIAYLACFQLCAAPAIVRLIRRKSSGDLSLWREGLLLAGVTLQLAVMLRTGAAWQVIVSPVLSGLSIFALAGTVVYYRR